VNDCVVAPPEKLPAPEAESVSDTPATPLPKRSVTDTVTGTPAPFAVPVAAPAILTVRASPVAFVTVIFAVAVAVPHVTVYVFVPGVVAIAFHEIAPDVTTKLRVESGRPVELRI
jgi:hypothetical protein